MPTNVYLSCATQAAVGLALAPTGPTDDFTDRFHLKTGTAAPAANDLFVLEIDRGGGIHFGDAVEQVELRLSLGARFVGAFVFLIDSDGEPIKNTLHWSWRTPLPAIGRFVNDYSTQSISYETPEATLTLTITGRSTVGFDDVYLTVTSVPVTISRLVAVRDPAGQRIVAFAVTSRGDAIIQTSPTEEASPQWQRITPPSGPAARLTGEIAISVGLGSGTPAPTLLSLTQPGNLWIASLGLPTATQLPLGLIDQVPIGMATSEIRVEENAPTIELFLIVKAASGARLLRRVLGLTPKPHFMAATWDDWGAVNGVRPSYTPGSPYRYIFVSSTSTLGNQAVYYVYAAADGTSWSTWKGLAKLPGGAAPASLTAFAWYSDPGHPKNVAIVVVGDDRAIYHLPDHDFNGQWGVSASRLADGPIVAGQGTNETPLTVSSLGNLATAGYWIKENMMPAWSPVGGAPLRSPAFATFQMDDENLPGGPRYFILAARPAGDELDTVPWS